MATFEIISKESQEVVYSGRITDWGTIANELSLIKGHGMESDAVYRFRGKEVSWNEIMDVCLVEQEKYYSARKKIYVHNGASSASNTWTAKWIKK